MALRFKSTPEFLRGLVDPLPGALEPLLELAASKRSHRLPRVEWSKVLLAELERAGHVGWKREHRFHPTRQWRFDCAHTALMLAIEVEGMKGSGKNPAGGHRGIKGFREDIEKYGEAFALGWAVLRVSTEDVRKGRALRRLEQRLARG